MSKGLVGDYDFNENGLQIKTSRVWPYIVQRGPDDCWSWTRFHHPLTHHGMIGVKIDGKFKMTYIHRVIYMLCRGPIPPGLHVTHDCLNPGCCNPSHLRLLSRNEAAARPGKQSKKKPRPKPQEVERNKWQIEQEEFARQMQEQFGFKGHV